MQGFISQCKQRPPLDVRPCRGSAPLGGNNDVPHIAFTDRIRRLFTARSRYFDLITDARAQGILRQPAQPMSDHELARAIREFQDMPLPDTELGARLAQPKPEH
jgi:hypothetical protein